jgi:hypothetical protein
MHSKIIGLTICKNNWALAAVSITYALVNHLDEVIVINHQSSDQTYYGLQELKKIWEDRIHIINLNEIDFLQSAIINSVLKTKIKNSSWVYIFDSDEFLITKNEISLKSFLNQVDSSTSAIRYNINNYISVKNFNDFNLEDYKDLKFKAVITRDKFSKNPKENLLLLQEGMANFFEFPFPSKLIIRYSDDIIIGAGAHSVINFQSNKTLYIGEEILSAAHFPFLTEKSLNSRAEHGLQLINLKFPKIHGWQNQLIYYFKAKNKLHQFWINHSLDQNIENEKNFKYIIDENFSIKIGSSLNLLKDKFKSNDLSKVNGSSINQGRSNESLVSFSCLVSLGFNYENIIKLKIKKDIF